MLDENGIEYEICVVANIIGNHYWGVNKEIKSGTKHFRPSTKVYCIFQYGGMGHEQIRVFGKPRKSFRMVDVVVRATYLKNFRVQKVYEPRVLAFLDKYSFADQSYFCAAEALEDFNANNIEIKEDQA